MTASHCNARPATLRTAHRPWALRLLDRVLAAQALHRQHQSLAGLDDAMLRDIGLTRFEANAEAARSVWNAPQHWRG